LSSPAPTPAPPPTPTTRKRGAAPPALSPEARAFQTAIIEAPDAAALEALLARFYADSRLAGDTEQRKWLLEVLLTRRKQLS
jgi:hypothetical protein